MNKLILKWAMNILYRRIWKYENKSKQSMAYTEAFSAVWKIVYMDKS